MFEKTAGFYNFAWAILAMTAVWLLLQIYQLLKAIHFMLKKWFDRDYIEPFERERGIFDGE